MHLPLSGKTALVTGASRRKGIGFAVARELAALGANVFVHHFQPHDAGQPWGGDDLDAVLSGIREALAPDAVAADQHADLRHAHEIDQLLDTATALTGSLDILVCNQALSGSDGSILEMAADQLDAHWQTNARASLLLTAGFARRKKADGASAPFDRPTGHVVWMTSGQGNGPMRGEVAYATSKAGLAGVTPTVAAELLDLGIALNTVNPGPVNTGYLDQETTDRDLSWLPEFLQNTPFGRVGRPEDPARLIGWLCTDAGSWVVGQVLSCDGGFALR